MRIATLVSHVDTLMWYDGPIMSSVRGDDKLYISLWVDTDYDSDEKRTRFDSTILVEVSEELYAAYKRGEASFLDIQKAAPNIYYSSSYFQQTEDDKACLGMYGERINFALIEACGWDATKDSFYDESLTRN